MASLLLLVCAAAAQVPARSVDLANSRLVDLTYTFDENTIYWPTAEGFKWKKDAWGPAPGGYFYASASYGASEHGGTHLDSPLHFAEGHPGTDQIPVTSLIAPAVVIDIAASCAQNPDYLLSSKDIAQWESAHTPIAKGSIVLIKTGWGKYWPDAKRYLGTDEHGAAAVAKLHFPGLDPEAARWLTQNRSIKAIGLDTASIDRGQSTMFESHRALFEKNVPAFENVANLDQLPVKGFTIVALPMKIKGGSGGPLRIIAMM